MTTQILHSAEALPKNGEFEIRIGNEIRNIGIPSRPSILHRIEKEMHKDEPDFHLLSEIIATDVGLSASVIKVANSPFFGFGKKVRSVSEALLVLGLKMTVQMVAGIALQQTFPHVPSLERFWDTAARTARVSGWFAQQRRRQLTIRPDDAYTFGLFRDCGIPLLMIPFPDYAALLARANTEPDRIFTAVEDEAMAINHAIVGSELAEDWLLPEDVSLAIRYHHELSAVAEGAESILPLSSRQLIAVAQTAEYLIQVCTGRNQTQEWNKLGAGCLRILGLAETDLVELASDAQSVVSAEL
jgi:HD-like signal output (HDOD) protein